MKKIVILTGATGGLGREFLKQILKEDIDEVWAIARNEEKLDELRKQYGEKVVPVSMDLSDFSSIIELEARLKEHMPAVQYLINNAGLAKMGNYNDFSLEEIDFIGTAILDSDGKSLIEKIELSKRVTDILNKMYRRD